MFLRMFLPGDYICRVGDEGNGMYFVLKGEVLVIAACGNLQLTKLKKG